MKSKCDICLVTEDQGTVAAVASVLENNGRLTADRVCRDQRELLALLEHAPTAGVLVDIDPKPTQILADLDPIIRRFVDARFIILSSSYRSDLVLEAMQVGARHFLLKDAIASDLGKTLRRLIPGDLAAGREQGAAITVLGASGGCGATTVAVNVANELHLINSELVLLVDLDWCYGAVATYLGLEGQYGIDHVLADSRRVDTELISTTASVYSRGLRALISPASAAASEAEPLQYDHLDLVVSACKDGHGYTVIDAARVSMDVAARLANASKRTLIVLQLNVKDVRRAREMVSALGNRGVSTDRIVLLVNRYRSRKSMITLKEAQTALGGIRLECVRNDFPGATRCINYGQPLEQVAPRSPLRRDLRDIIGRAIEPQA